MSLLTEFTIKEIHLRLLQKMYVGWGQCEFGAPEIDPKRPYGNSDVICDMMKIIGLPATCDTEEVVVDMLIALHKETEIALQICLNLQQFKTGDFIKKDEYDAKSWESTNET